MDYLLKLSRRPPVAVAPSATVFDAVQAMSRNRVGAIAVVNDENNLLGIFTERDLMERVVLQVRDPSTTLLGDVMTSPVESVRANDKPERALATMVNRHIRHLAVTDDSNHVLGMLSIRNLLQDQLENARREAESLEAYLSADGPGG